MKKVLFVIVLFVFAISANQARASVYSVSEQAIDQLFDSATETVMISTDVPGISEITSSASTNLVAAKEKDAVAAILLDFFLGGLGVHRFYLGTKPMTGIGYILTCGGIFGIVPLVDFIVLIIDHEDISPYVNNPKFFMW